MKKKTWWSIACRAGHPVRPWEGKVLTEAQGSTLLDHPTRTVGIVVPNQNLYQTEAAALGAYRRACLDEATKCLARAEALVKKARKWQEEVDKIDTGNLK